MKGARGLIAVVGLAAFAACAEAGGQATGGGFTDAGALAVTPPVFIPPKAAPVECGTGTKWSELYRDIFGPTNKPGSCVLFGNCHGSAGEDGAFENGGLQCFNLERCRESMIKSGLATVENRSKPEESRLVDAILRRQRADGSLSGKMPDEPQEYVFPQSCIDRISGWIANGVPAD